MLRAARATLRSRGGRLLIAGDGEPMTSDPLRASDLKDAFSAYREVTTLGSG